MDIESFSACLAYIESTKDNSATAVALISVVLGFALSFIATNFQDYFRSRKKKRILLEETQHLMQSAKRTFIGAARVIAQIRENFSGTYTYNFGLSNSYSFSDEFYAAVMDRLSKSQRENFKLARESGILVTAEIEWFRKEGGNHPPVTHMHEAFRLLNDSGKFYSNCKNLLRNTSHLELSLYRLAEEFDLDYDFLRDTANP